MKIKLTDGGRKMLLSFAKGNRIRFTKAIFGNGDYRITSGTQDVPRVMNAVKTVSFDEAPTIDEAQKTATLKVSFDNKDMESGFHVTEIGYFAALITYAEDGTTIENEGEEELYAIGNADESEADYIPPADERLVNIVYDSIVYIGDADVSAVLSENAQYATKVDFENHIKNQNNPHGVSKGQVGLSEVPNVSTNDQTPTYEKVNKLESLKSGETLGGAFSKIQFAIESLIKHIGTKKGNPHGVTINEIGGAKAKHTHAAQDINSGVLPTERGGTGRSRCTNFSWLETKPENGKSDDWGRCYGHSVLPNGLLIQWGRANIDSHKFFIKFAKEYLNTNYVLIFPTCGDDFVPVWKNPEKSTNGFSFVRTGGTSLLSASQTADWLAIGQIKEE